MMGKEGAVDKPTEQELILNYNRGWRAYDIHDTRQKLFQNVDTGNTYWLLSDEDHTDWHALRAYQDEQRKKGEPITLYIRDWHDRDYEQNEGQFLSYYLSHRDEPQIMVYANSDSESNRIAKFTNFRWRPGHGPKRVSSTNDSRDGNPVPNTSVSMHDLISRLENNRPKEKAKVRIGPDYLSVVYPPFEIPN